jgi:pseudaminic acid biosynthesis-associated methylase
MTNSKQSPQEAFWQGSQGVQYTEQNKDYDLKTLKHAWGLMLKKTKEINTVLECGSNRGRNLVAQKDLYPKREYSLIEINSAAYKLAIEAIHPKYHYLGSITDSKLPDNYFDLAYCSGVMIHIHPQDLLINLERIHSYSKKYVLIAEYFNRTPVEIPYRDGSDLLFKRDFGKFFMDHFDVEVVDYGFLWSQEYEDAGFDDMNWWLFKKK